MFIDMISMFLHFLERKAEDVDGARDSEAEGAGRGVRPRTQRLEEPTQAEKTGRNKRINFSVENYLKYPRRNEYY